MRFLQLSDLGQPGDGAKVWADAGKHHKARRQSNYEEARKAFTKAAKTQLDWPEMLWEAWLAFEHSHGSVGEIQDALGIVERARTQVEARRAKVLISS